MACGKNYQDLEWQGYPKIQRIGPRPREKEFNGVSVDKHLPTLQAETTGPKEKEFTEQSVDKHFSTLQAEATDPLPDVPIIIDICKASERRPSTVSTESLSSTSSRFVQSAHKVTGFINQKVEERQQAMLEHHDDRLTHFSHQVVWVTQFFFTMAAIVLLVKWMQNSHPESYVATFFVTSLASAAYFAKATGMGDAIVFGIRVPFVRYADWILTTPLMLYELCTIGNAPGHVTMMVIGCDLLMLGFGIVSACIDRKDKLLEKYLWFLASCAFFILMLGALHFHVATGSALEQPADVQTLFSRLEWLTIVAWSGYPVIVLLGRAHAGLISKATEDLGLCVLDCIAKIGMEGLIVVSCSAPGAMCHATGNAGH